MKMKAQSLKKLSLFIVGLCAFISVVLEIIFYYYLYQKGDDPSWILSLTITAILLWYCIDTFKQIQKKTTSQLYTDWQARVTKKLKKNWHIPFFPMVYFFALTLDGEPKLNGYFHIFFFLSIMTIFIILDPDQE